MTIRTIQKALCEAICNSLYSSIPFLLRLHKITVTIQNHPLLTFFFFLSAPQTLHWGSFIINIVLPPTSSSIALILESLQALDLRVLGLFCSLRENKAKYLLPDLGSIGHVPTIFSLASSYSKSSQKKGKKRKD